VVEAGGEAFPEALLFSAVNAIPGGAHVLKLTGSKAAQALSNVLKKTGLFTGAKGISRGEIPSFAEYATDFAMIGGLDLFHSAGKYAKPIYSKLKKANIPPQEAVERIQQVAQEKGYDLNEPKDIARAVTDITKKRTKIRPIAQEIIEQVKTPEGTITETAEALAERPIEKYIAQEKASKAKKERGLTERETLKRKVAAEGIPVLEEKIKSVQDDVLFLREKITEKMPKYIKRLAKTDLASTEADLKALKRQKEDLEGIAKHGQKPFRESDIDKHIQELEKAAASPASEEAKELNRLFERDQKWIDKGLQLDKKGKLPPQSHTDYRIKILESYQKAYSKAIDKLEKNIKVLSRSKQKAHQNQLNLLKKNLKINEAKIKLHKDKLNSLYELMKPGSSLVKQRLKSLRKDVVELQKDYVKLQKISDAIETKTTEAFNKSLLKDVPKPKDLRLKNADKIADKFIDKDLTKEVDIEAKKAEISGPKLKQLLKKLKPEIADIIKTFKENPQRASRKVKNLYNHMPLKYRIPVGAVVSTVLGGLGVPSILTYMVLPSGTVLRGLSLAGGKYIRKGWNSWRMNSLAKELADERSKSLGSGMRFMKELDEKLSPKDKKEVVKRYEELYKAA